MVWHTRAFDEIKFGRFGYSDRFTKSRESREIHGTNCCVGRIFIDLIEKKQSSKGSGDFEEFSAIELVQMAYFMVSVLHTLRVRVRIAI